MLCQRFWGLHGPSSQASLAYSHDIMLLNLVSTCVSGRTGWVDAVGKTQEEVWVYMDQRYLWTHGTG